MAEQPDASPGARRWLGGLTAVGVLAVGAAVAINLRTTSGPERPPPEALAPPVAAPTPERNPITSPPPRAQQEGAGPAVRPLDARVFVLEGSNLDGRAEVEITTARDPYQVVAFVDPGATSVSRVHVDLDRDGSVDEIWGFEGRGLIRRQVSPDDDGTYADTFVWSTGRWVPVDAG